MMSITGLAHFAFLDFILVKNTNNEDPNYSVFSVLLLLHLSLWWEYSSQHFLLKHRQSVIYFV
jgi:hypothetical protein